MNTPFNHKRINNAVSVTILGFDGALSSAITGVADLFSLAGVSWQRFNQQNTKRCFDVTIASIDGRAIRCINRIEIKSQASIKSIKHCDLLLIPTIAADITTVLADNKSLLPHIIRLRDSGCELASNCSGAFFLAEAGLLNDREATTHWGYSELFAARYPSIKVQANKLITQSDGIFCAGGGMAWYDLALLLIERYQDRQTAQETAKSHLIDMQRGNQGVYANLRSHQQHNDEQIIAAQRFIEQHFKDDVSVSTVALEVNLSERTLLRRFKKNVGLSPIEYIQRVRLEQAKRLLEADGLSVAKTANSVGYEDLSSFTRLFKRETGLSPFQYKMKFSKPY